MPFCFLTLRSKLDKQNMKESCDNLNTYFQNVMYRFALISPQRHKLYEQYKRGSKFNSHRKKMYCVDFLLFNNVYFTSMKYQASNSRLIFSFAFRVPISNKLYD